MAGSSWRWYSFIVQVLKQQQQKKKMEKKTKKKKKKKSQFEAGTIYSPETPDSWWLFSLYCVCSLFPGGGSQPPSVGLLPTHTILPSWF